MSFKYDGVKCPNCGGEMISRSGKYGVFWGCKSFPNCKGTRDSQGRSKADREKFKAERAKERGEQYEPDLNPFSEENKKTEFTFNRRK